MDLDALRASMPDPTLDFDAAVAALCSVVLDDARRDIPDGTPSKEKSRLLVLSAARRLIDGFERAERGVWPDYLIELNMRSMVQTIGWYYSLREEDSVSIDTTSQVDE